MIIFAIDISEKSFLSCLKNILKALGKVKVNNLWDNLRRTSLEIYSPKRRVRFWAHDGQKYTPYYQDLPMSKSIKLEIVKTG